MILKAFNTEAAFFADIGLRTLVVGSGLMACESIPMQELCK